ncbi:SusC/RagA family TonB-linked outer membrane protein [Robertkochia marina]|uniref:SusC/RagA family TonB-linked outer membrane protein n=1 Tax=Robertkochia marina TaxID=1227945 RepID=A0A4S3M4T3_9FLAO|nr:SusC/RagA family TonB-linked outer membrane protein [Robertkochia marina]THD69920.1 SusC/RagA family TonB-linked outer membrane protein [Robertkochia marina]TRZ46733.1 SusC/RagA family TonB-linked outer membrane protein [Robertkochia marina]
MKTKLKGYLALLLVLVAQISFAQVKTITGTVTDQDGLPLPGASVAIQGTTQGTQTDFDGNYAIEAAAGQVLVFSYVGQKTEERTVGASNVIDVVLGQDAQALEEVIVTAQGIKRERKALGYAVSEVASEQLEQRAEGDIGRVLSGKASGVQITAQSGLSGSGTNIIIRGLSSFSGSNQPLFIVDGVPFSSDTNAQGDFVDGNAGGSRFFDLDPNNIESINVLKGLAAATLYGTQGRNGVILITTKNGASGGGAKKNEVTVNTSLFFNDIASLPDYTNKWGNGFDQAFGWFFSNWGPNFEENAIGGWGSQAAIDENGTLPHPYSTASSGTGIPQAFPEFQGVRYDYKPYQSAENFFKTGTVLNTSVNFNTSSDDGKMSMSANMGHLTDEGFTPENKVIRNTLGIGGRAELSNNFTVSGTLNYARTDFRSPPIAAGDGNTVFGASEGSSVFSNVFFTPRSVDMLNLPYQNPLTGASVYYRQNNSIQHPLWTVNNAQTRQETNRTFGNTTIVYKVNDNMNLTYRLGLDMYSENNTNYQNKGGVSDVARTRSGFYNTWNNTNTIWDHNLFLSGLFDITEKIGVSFNVGATARRDVFDQNGVSSSGQQVFDVIRHFNFELQDEIQFFQQRNINGMYGQADFDFGDFVYLTVAGRNDWVSNLSEENRSIFYPSVSTSFVPTSAFDALRGSSFLNFLKVRAGYGTSATFPTGYPTVSTLNLNTQRWINAAGGFAASNEISATLGNPNLRPETLKELEFGVESRFWNNRITLNASYFNRITEDLIVDRRLDASSGARFIQTNIGEIEVDGVEVDLGVDIFRNPEGFNWNVNANFNAIEPIVNDLGADTDLIVYAGFGDLGNAAIEGEPLGTIVGSRILRNDQGQPLINSEGDYIVEAGQFAIGDPNPDYTLNVSNSFSFGNFNFSFLLQHVAGGDIYSQTIATLLGRGLVQDTDNREATYILPGINENTGQPNNIQINNSDYHFDNVLFGPSELNIYDGSVIRLQEVAFGYSLPKKILDRTPFGALTFTVSGQNLWYEAYNTPDSVNFDPNQAGLGVGNGQGFDWLTGPSSRRYGFSVKATF